MKKLILLFLLVFGTCAVMAQDDTSSESVASLEQLLVYENPKIYVRVGEIKYVPKKVSEKATSIVVDVLSSVATKSNTTSVPVEDESMVAPAIETLQQAASKALRFQLVADDFTQQQLDSHPCLELTATITGCNTTVRMHNNYSDKLITISAFVYLTDPKTGEIKASRQVTSDTWASEYETFEGAKNRTIYNLGVYTINIFNRWYPLRGHMLEKGFEKGKKQKLKEIFIDLGSANGLGTGYTCNVYTVRRIAGRIARKYIGRGRVAEVLGDDITSVELKKGADLIKQAFDNGAELAVEVF